MPQFPGQVVHVACDAGVRADLLNSAVTVDARTLGESAADQQPSAFHPRPNRYLQPASNDNMVGVPARDLSFHVRFLTEPDVLGSASVAHTVKHGEQLWQLRISHAFFRDWSVDQHYSREHDK